jgi:plasmid stabilization system protein ParE
MKTVILASAKADLHDLRCYILTSFSKEVWEKTYTKLKEAIRNVGAFPNLGAVPQELSELHIYQYRQLICGMNRIIYEVRGDTLYVHAIVDTRRELSALLMRRLIPPSVF